MAVIGGFLFGYDTGVVAGAMVVLRKEWTTAVITDVMQELVVSIHTVRNHIRNILTKLNAQSRLEAATVAARQGLIAPGASGTKGGR